MGSQGPGHDPCGMHSVLKRASIASGAESIHANRSSTTSCSRCNGLSMHSFKRHAFACMICDEMFSRSTCLRPHTNWANDLDV